MKIILFLSALSMSIILSCSSGKINSTRDLQGSWISRADQTIYQGFNDRVYYQFTFKKDSFFVEIGVMDDQTDVSYEPFRSKGLYVISGDRLILTGVAKAEGSRKFNLEYKESFDYDYDLNYLKLYSLNRWNLQYYEMIRRSPIIR